MVIKHKSSLGEVDNGHVLLISVLNLVKSGRPQEHGCTDYALLRPSVLILMVCTLFGQCSQQGLPISPGPTRACRTGGKGFVVGGVGASRRGRSRQNRVRGGAGGGDGGGRAAETAPAGSRWRARPHTDPCRRRRRPSQAARAEPNAVQP
jgi:hypothetical protein